MPSNEVQLSLNTQDFEARIARVKKDLAEVIQLASQATLGGNAGTPQAAAIRAGLSSVSTSESSVKSTATNAGPSGPTPASAAASQAVISAQRFGDIQLTGPYYQTPAGKAALAAAGFAPPAATPPAFGTQTMVAATVATAQTQGWNATLVMPPRQSWMTFDQTQMMPTAMYTTAQMASAALAPTQQMAAMQGIAIAGGGPSGGFGGFGSAFRRLGGPLGKGGAGVAGLALGQFLSVSTGETISGHTDIQGRAGALGMAMGGAAGLALSGGNPWIAGGAAMLGSTVMQWLAAPLSRAEQVSEGLMPILGLMPGTRGSSLVSWAEGLAAGISPRIYSNVRSLSAQGIAAAGTAAFQGLVAGGFDPNQILGVGATYGRAPYQDPGQPAPIGRGFGSNLAAAAEYAVRAKAQFNRPMIQTGIEGEEAWKTITRRMAIRYPDDKALSEVMNRIGPIWGTTPETGGNIADILGRFGPQGTFQYYQSRTEPGQIEPMTLNELSRASAKIRTFDRQASISGLRTRNSGMLMYSDLSLQASEIADLPRGRESIAYAETFARRRDAGALAFEQRTAIDFGIPQARVEAARGILAAMPYGPGNRMAVELTAMNISGQQIGRLNAYMRERRSRGELTEMEELDINQQIGRLQVSVAQGMGALSEGVLDRIPALSTNAPNGWRRFDSMQMAAINLGGMGSPNRRHGAMGGAQARMQDQFISMFGMGSLNPYSKTEGLNNPAVGEMTAILRQMLELMMRGAQIPGFNRPANSNPLPPNNGTGPQGQQVPF